MLACNCLNVIVESDSDNFMKVTSDSLHLNQEAPKEILAEQELLAGNKIYKVTNVHDCLVSTTRSGPWTVARCVNCNMYTHAVNWEGVTMIINSKLLPTPSILELRKSNSYSKVYNIIVNTGFKEAVSYDYLSAEAELAVASFKQKANDYVKREVAMTEEKIKQLTEQLYTTLDECREQVLNEQRALTRIILNHKMNVPVKTASTKMDTTASEITSKRPKVPEDNVSDKKMTVHSNKVQTKVISNINNESPVQRRPSRKQPLSKMNSYESEVLFDFEDMEDLNTVSPSEDESDIEEKERADGIQIKQSKLNNSHMNLAKSLPMNIPAFTPFQGHDSDDQDDMFQHPEDPLDIAAGIKALAKSVHGDAIFGDLPKPRCRTNV